MSLSSPSDINKTILERCQNDVQDLIQMNLAVAETFSPSVGKKGKILVGFEKFQSPKRCRGGELFGLERPCFSSNVFSFFPFG